MQPGARMATWGGGGGGDPYFGYVSDGLVLQLDGAVPPSGTAWTDTVGGYVFDTNGNTWENGGATITAAKPIELNYPQSLVDEAGDTYTIELEVDATGAPNFKCIFGYNGEFVAYKWSGTNCYLSKVLGTSGNCGQVTKSLLTFVFDKTAGFKGYADGVLKLTISSVPGASSPAWLVVDTKNYIAMNGSGYTKGTNGGADGCRYRALRIYGRELTQAEITANYTNFLTKTW